MSEVAAPALAAPPDSAPQRVSRSSTAWLLGFVALLAAAPLILNGYALYVLTLVGIYSLVALGLNLVTGYAGQISLAQAAFFGTGGYATGLLTERLGVPYLASLLLGSLFTAGLGVVAGLPALRLKSLYLAIATLGFGVVLQKILFEWRSLTGGGGGLELKPAVIGPISLGSGIAMYYLVLAVACGGVWMAWNLARGRTGRALAMIKASEIAAGSLAISVPAYKIVAFALAAFYAGLAGGLYAYVVRYLNPESFSVGLSISFLSMVVIGGLGTVGGSIVGAIFYVIVPELFRDFKDAPGLVFGLLLIAVMVFLPDGLWGLRRHLRWWRS